MKKGNLFITFRCQATNELGGHSDVIKYIATDCNCLMNVTDDLPRVKVPGDMLTVTCRANRWLYKEVVLYSVNKEVPGNTDTNTPGSTAGGPGYSIVSSGNVTGI